MTSVAEKAITLSGQKAEWTIFPQFCKGCGLCIEKCPVKTLHWSSNLGVYGTPTPEVNENISCSGCNMCVMVCPDAAITVKKINK